MQIIHYSPKSSLIALLLAAALLTPMPGQAMDSTEVLPASINSPAFRYGIVAGVDSKYTANGSVQSLNDTNTINFNSDLLQKISPEVTDLVNILNQYSKQQLGAQVNLGTLRAETKPNVKYMAPIFARGLTDRITLAIAMPIVFYENKLRLVQSASNVPSICSQIQGVPEIKEACDKLGNTKIVDAVKGELANKGYKPLEDRSETVFGDVQLVGIWKFFEEEEKSSALRTTLTLPTGPGNDPDDLADLGTFGETAIEEQVLFNYLPFHWLRLAAKTGYKFYVPDSVEMRVPSGPNEILPGPETKEKVSRRKGGALTLGTAATIGIGKSVSVAGGYEFVSKASDSYSGNKSGDYDALAKDSKSTAHKLRAAISYDTIALYQRTKSFPPLKVDYEVTNTVAGTNTDRQLVNEVSLTMFF